MIRKCCCSLYGRTHPGHSSLLLQQHNLSSLHAKLRIQHTSLKHPKTMVLCKFFSQSDSVQEIKDRFDQLTHQQRIYLETIKKDYDDATLMRQVKHSQASERFLGKFTSLYSAYKDYCDTLNTIVECHELLKEPEMEEIAREDIITMDKKLQSSYSEIQTEIIDSLLPSGNEIFLEVRMAAGGVESSMFASELLRTYEMVAVSRGFQWTMLEEDARGDVGIARAIASVSGTDVLGMFQFEAGVHRVQRVPFNDTRTHTSTAVVIVTNKPEDVKVDINEDDLEISYMRASGPGGQFVQRTMSKCRIVHKPTGISVTNQTSRLAQDNKKECIKKLSAILLKQELDETLSDTEQTKKSQAKQGDRSDKIRTYNYKSGVITDHRYKVEVAGIPDYFSDPEGFSELHGKVSTVWQLQQLAQIADQISSEKSKKAGQTSN